MGSPLGSFLADIFMADLEQIKRKSIISEVTLHIRFTEDTFVACNSHKHAFDMLNRFNPAHANIRFTME